MGGDVHFPTEGDKQVEIEQVQDQDMQHNNDAINCYHPVRLYATLHIHVVTLLGEC